MHHSIFHPETREMLQQYLHLVNAGQNAEQAYSTTFANFDGDLEDELKDYGRGRMPTSRTTQTFNPSSDITITALDEDDATVLMLFPRRRAYHERAVESAARRFPQNPQALAELAQLRLAENRLSDAIEVADTALAIDPDHSEANTFKGTALLRGAAESGDRTDTRWAEARALFVRANRNNPQYPLALLRYYQSFPDPDSRPENAIAALEQAHLFVPQNPETRMQLAIEFLYAGRFEEAALLAKPIAQSAHTENAFAVAAQTIIERADEGNRDREFVGLEFSSFIDED